MNQLKTQTPEWMKIGSLIAWIVPLGAFAVFLGLFASANPLIEYRLMKIDFSVIFKLFDLPRMLFWAGRLFSPGSARISCW